MKGQSFRAYDTDNERVFNDEVSVELHISVETESCINKDNADAYDYPEVVGYSFDMTVEQQVESFMTHSDLTVHATDIDGGAGYNLSLVKMNGSAVASTIASGEFWATSTSYKADNKKVITATHKFEGTGALSIGK